jgi:hypothetical protein
MPGNPSGCSLSRIKSTRWGSLRRLAFMQHPIYPALLILAAFFSYSNGCHYGGERTMGENALRISVERTGGFAGVTIATSVDAANLPPVEARKLRQMVDEADFFNLPGNITSRSPQPDRFQYELKVKEPGRQHTVLVSEEVMPPKLKPLVKWLMEAARKGRR